VVNIGRSARVRVIRLLTEVTELDVPAFINEDVIGLDICHGDNPSRFRA
jgi:hypothetical protein